MGAKGKPARRQDDQVEGLPRRPDIGRRIAGTDKRLEGRLDAIAEDLPCLAKLTRRVLPDDAVDDLDPWPACAASRREALWSERHDRELAVHECGRVSQRRDAARRRLEEHEDPRRPLRARSGPIFNDRGGKPRMDAHAHAIGVPAQWAFAASQE